MDRKPRDPEVDFRATISRTLQADYAEEDLARPDPAFAWIKARPSRQVGAIGEKLLAAGCAAKGLKVLRSPDVEADRVIEGVRVPRRS